MKHSVILTIASLLSVLFLTFHLADDIVRHGAGPGSPTTRRWKGPPQGVGDGRGSGSAGDRRAILFKAKCELTTRWSRPGHR
jgi:hypothetical protein